MRTLAAAILTATAILTTPPPATAYTATLTWADNSDNELGFVAERAPGKCATAAIWATIATTAANTTTTTDPAVTPGTDYCYRVRAFNNSRADGSGQTQYSPPSNLVDFFYPLASPAAPGQLTATPAK